MSNYYAGQGIELSVQFEVTDSAEPIDPDEVYLLIAAAGESPVSYVYPEAPGPITRSGEGNYGAVIDSTDFVTGAWTYQWVGTGNVKSLAPGSFYVSPPPLGLPTPPTAEDVEGGTPSSSYEGETQLFGGVPNIVFPPVPDPVIYGGAP